MVPTETKEFIHRKVGEMILDMSFRFRDRRELKRLSGEKKDLLNFDGDAGHLPVLGVGGVPTEDELANIVFESGMQEYFGAQRNMVKYPQLTIVREDYYRFLSIFDDGEIHAMYRRHAALCNQDHHALRSFESILPIIKKRIANALNLIRQTSDFYAFSITEYDLQERYISLSIK